MEKWKWKKKKKKKRRQNKLQFHCGFLLHNILQPSVGVYKNWRLCLTGAKKSVTKHFIEDITKTRLFKYIENFISKIWKFSDKNSDIFRISAQNIDCGYSLEPPRRGGSNEYPQSMFLAEIRKNNVYPCKPQFYYIKVGFKGVKII